MSSTPPEGRRAAAAEKERAGSAARRRPGRFRGGRAQRAAPPSDGRDVHRGRRASGQRAAGAHDRPAGGADLARGDHDLPHPPDRPPGGHRVGRVQLLDGGRPQLAAGRATAGPVRPRQAAGQQPRCADALRSLGFTDISSAVDNTTEGLVMHLRHRLPPGQTIALQLKTPAMHDLAHSLREAGHEVVAVPTFQVLPSNSPDLMRRLVGQVVRRQVDAIALTSAEVARSLLWYARTGDQFDELCQALATGVTAVCLGPLTAAPLRELDIPVRVADAPYTDQLAQAVRAVLRERVHRIETGPHTIEIRGEAVLLDGRLIALQQGPSPCCACWPTTPTGCCRPRTYAASCRSGRRRRPRDRDGGVPAAAVAARRGPCPDRHETRLPAGGAPSAARRRRPGRGRAGPALTPRTTGSTPDMGPAWASRRAAAQRRIMTEVHPRCLSRKPAGMATHW
ncbi:uroporphyrinogen-III synthase [Catellatospora coxensis]